MLEYGAEIVTYLKGKEKETVISQDFIDDSHVTKEMRSILVDWLIQVISTKSPFYSFLSRLV